MEVRTECEGFHLKLGPVFECLRGGGLEVSAEADAGGKGVAKTEAEAIALLDGAGVEETVPALVMALNDHRSSEQVATHGCQRIAAAFAAVAENATKTEALRSAYMAAAGAKCVLEILRHHCKGDLPVVIAASEALGRLLEGPPNHAAKDDDLWDEVDPSSLVASASVIACRCVSEHRY